MGSYLQTSLENTYLYLARLQQLTPNLCWGKYKHPSFPLSILGFIQTDWLVDFFDKLFCVFFPASTLMHIRLFMYVSCTNAFPYSMYLKFAIKQGIFFFYLPSWRVEQKCFHTDRATVD